jgi:hypothetical protein
MRTGVNPTRRNRNIGTAKQGHGQNNRLVIPLARDRYSSLDCVGKYTSEERTIQGQNITFVVEKVRVGSYHPCTIDDVVWLLGVVPLSDWVGIRTVVFRQPTRKQVILNPAWGRLRYSGELSTAQRQSIATGPMILLDAIDDHMSLKWSSALGPDDLTELNRLQEDGHSIERIGSGFKIRVTPSSARNTQLYRTLLHEIGHWFDWLQSVEGPTKRGEPFEQLMERYFARPSSEREAFAHRYATEMHEELYCRGLIPFERLANGS